MNHLSMWISTAVNDDRLDRALVNICIVCALYLDSLFSDLGYKVKTFILIWIIHTNIKFLKYLIIILDTIKCLLYRILK